MTPGERARRDVLGDAYVDAALAGAGDDPAAQAFQAFVMDRAWGEWARPDLGHRDRSLLTIGILAALGRDDELVLHLRGARRNGLTDVELEEVVRHIAAYAGMPAALATRRAVAESRGG